MTMIELMQRNQNLSTAASTTSSPRWSDVSLAIEPGRLTILKGPSGSGKTTLMALIGCMARPSSGRIRLHGIRDIVLPG